MKGDKFKKSKKKMGKDEFQTPQFVCLYMKKLLNRNLTKNKNTLLEPTPGDGNIVFNALDANEKCFEYLAPKDYFLSRDKIFNKYNFDGVIMNPPFSSSTAFGLENAPESWSKLKGMKVGYQFLYEALELAPVVIALMPWFTISDSDVRMRKLLDFGLVSVTLLPRKTFNYTRIQTCVLELKKGFKGVTKFNYLRNIEWVDGIDVYKDLEDEII